MELLFEKESYDIRGACFEVYRTFHDSQKEVVCHNALFEELATRGFKVEKNKRIQITYKGKPVGTYVPDLVVNDTIIVELKCKPQVIRADRQQFWYYLKNSQFRLGFLVNFGATGGVEIYRAVHTNK